MPQYTDITVPADTWTLLTDADVTNITFQNKGRYHIYIKATTSTAAPTTFAGALEYAPGQGERHVAMGELFAGLTGADRVWAYSPSYASTVAVSHA